MVPHHNGLVWSAQASDPHACRLRAVRSPAQTARQHDYPPSADLLLMMTFAGAFDVDSRLALLWQIMSDGIAFGIPELAYQ